MRGFRGGAWLRPKLPAATAKSYARRATGVDFPALTLETHLCSLPNMNLPICLAACLHILLVANSLAEAPVWIWRSQQERPSPAGERAWLRRTFSVGNKIEKATLEMACAGAMEVYVNGKSVGSSAEFRQPVRVDVTAHLKGWGENTIAVFGRTTADGAGFICHLFMEQEYGKRQALDSDSDWRISIDNPKGWEQPGFNDSTWERVAVLGKLGDPPFGNVFEVKSSSATPPEEITVPAGFRVELLRSAGPREGSWVAMTADPLGRLYISPQNAIPESGFGQHSGWGGIWRVTLDGRGQISQWDKVLVPIGGCMGMCWAFDSLYLSGQGPEGQAIYRCKDTNGDGNVDAWSLFKNVAGGGGEHGAHGMVEGPDGKLYIIMGNATPPVEGIDPNSPCQHVAEDDLLPRIKDPVATFFDGVKSPYGHVLRTDPDGLKWELWCVGMRNAYDLDFSARGELFTYDSDMEWDVGLPWYRPTRILHLVAGAEFGFREGSAKMPEYYPDTMPAVGPVGLGSPTGVKFGTKSNWPAEWRSAFFAMDWTYGRIFAVKLLGPGEGGNGETGTHGNVSEFVKGRGLPVTDLEFGRDGSMYFTVGGRGTQGGLYRISYVGGETSQNSDHKLSSPAWAALGKHFGPPNATALDAAWSQLTLAGASDENAATGRALLEGQPVEKWRSLVLDATDFSQGNRGFLALARCGSQDDRRAIAEKIVKLRIGQPSREFASIAEAQASEKLGLAELRLWQLILVRGNSPDESLRQQALQRLVPLFPNSSRRMNRELSQLLVFLRHGESVNTVFQLLEAARQDWEKAGHPLPNPLQQGPQEEMIWYARVLCEVPAASFSVAQQETYFRWFDETAPQLKGGNNFIKFLEVMRQRALAKVPPADRDLVEKAHQTALAQLDRQKPSEVPNAPDRKFVKVWTLADLESKLGQVKAGRRYARGKEIFSSMLCAKCHHMNGEGGSVGPDLTAVGGRFSAKDTLEAILEPNKAISEQYAAQVVETKTDSVLGLIAAEDGETLTMYADPFGETKKSLAKAEIVKRERAKISLMPAGLLSSLQEEEILDLLAYLISGGKAEAENFKPTP